MLNFNLILGCSYLLGIFFPLGYTLLVGQGLMGFSWGVVDVALSCYILSLTAWVPIIMITSDENTSSPQSALAAVGLLIQMLMAIFLIGSVSSHFQYIR